MVSFHRWRVKLKRGLNIDNALRLSDGRDDKISNSGYRDPIIANGVLEFESWPGDGSRDLPGTSIPTTGAAATSLTLGVAAR